MATALSSSFFPAALVSPFSSVSIRGRNAGKSCLVSCCQCSPSSSANEKQDATWVASRRDVITRSFSAISAGVFTLPAFALLETDDDESLLEKVKEDRKKRIEKRGAAISFKQETESVQKAVYELSKAGQAIDGEDYGQAIILLGTNDVDWIKDVKAAISKVNKSSEEEGEAANFSAALQSLQSAVGKRDLKLSKSAFVASASALEKWSSLTGLSDQIEGL